MSYSYRAYGVGISSTSKIAGLETCPLPSDEIQLHFETGSEPEWAHAGRSLPGRIISRLPDSEKPAEPAFLLTEHGGGACYELVYSEGTRFVVNSSADRVWGTFQQPLTEEDLATFFLGPVMGFLLRRRRITCLHASGVEMNGRAVLFCGDGGYGKSTTAAALGLRGLPVLSDDIVPLLSTKGRFWIVPGYPRVCLWPDAVAKLLGDEQALPKLTPVWEKRYLPLDNGRARFTDQRQPLGIIYLFGARSDSAGAPRIEEVRPREALLELVQNTYMNWLLDREQRAEEFDELWRVVQQTPVARIVPHRDGAKIAALCELILAHALKTLHDD